MKNLNTISEIRNALKSGEITSAELVRSAVEAFEADKKTDLPLNAFLEIYDDVMAKAEAADAEIAAARAASSLDASGASASASAAASAGASASGATQKSPLDALFAEKPLLGIPFANKDNISARGKRLTCASKILEGYVAPYDATVIARLEKAGAIALGRCNQDEFAMGSSTEYSVYGATRNPLNRAYVSGGSSGGSAATVAQNWVSFSLGTETGGSVRLPASYCGIYGLKPTYGVLSRWGVVAYGSSLDQVGVMAHTPSDIAETLVAMCGEDFYDDTSADLPECESLRSLQAASDSDLAALRIAIPRQFLESKGLDSDVAKVFEDVRNWFSAKGAKIDVVDLPILDAAIACYYVIAPSEAASNLSRFDGIRYGKREDPGTGYDDLYVKTRSDGFGPEVKRRIIIGNYVLSEQFSGDTYKKGMTVRARIQHEIAALFENYDLMLCPTCPTPAFKLGAKVDDPLEMYLSDLFTTFVNLARIPSLSVPAGYSSGYNAADGQKNANGEFAAANSKASVSSPMPIGVQFAGAMFSEARILRIAQAWENEHPGCGVPLA